MKIERADFDFHGSSRAHCVGEGHACRERARRGATPERRRAGLLRHARSQRQWSATRAQCLPFTAGAASAPALSAGSSACISGRCRTGTARSCSSPALAAGRGRRSFPAHEGEFPKTGRPAWPWADILHRHCRLPFDRMAGVSSNGHNLLETAPSRCVRDRTGDRRSRCPSCDLLRNLCTSWCRPLESRHPEPRRRRRISKLQDFGILRFFVALRGCAASPTQNDVSTCAEVP